MFMSPEMFAADKNRTYFFGDLSKSDVYSFAIMLVCVKFTLGSIKRRVALEPYVK